MVRIAALIYLAALLAGADQIPLVLGPQGQPQQIAVGDTLFTQPTSGLLSAIPSASSNNAAQIYWATDTNLIYRSSGSAWVPLAVGGSGTVSSVGLALPGIFSVSGSPVTTTGTLSAALTMQSANAVWAGPASGGAAQPTFRSLISSDIPALPYDAVGAAAAVLASSLQKSANLSDVANAATARANIGAGTGSVSSVAATVPGFLSIAGSPVTGSGTLAIGYSGTALPVANGGTGDTIATAYALLAGGTTSAGPFQSLASVGTSGQILTSNGASSLPTWQNAPATGVTSVGLSLPAIFTVSGSPVTSSGTLTGTLASESANAVFIGPASGSAVAPTFRALVAADIPTALNSIAITGTISSTGAATLDTGATGSTFGGALSIGGNITMPDNAYIVCNGVNQLQFNHATGVYLPSSSQIYCDGPVTLGSSGADIIFNSSPKTPPAQPLLQVAGANWVDHAGAVTLSPPTNAPTGVTKWIWLALNNNGTTVYLQVASP